MWSSSCEACHNRCNAATEGAMRFWISGFRGPAGSPEQADYTLVRPNAERGSRITTCSVRGARGRFDRHRVKSYLLESLKYTNTTHRAYAKYHESEMQRRRGRAALRTTGLIVVPCRGISLIVRYRQCPRRRPDHRKPAAGRGPLIPSAGRYALPSALPVRMTVRPIERRGGGRRTPDSAADSESGGAEI